MKLLYSSKLVSPAKVLNTNLICMDSQRHLKESKDGRVTLYMLPYTGTSTLIPLAHRTTCITKVRCGVCRNSASKIGRLGPFRVGGVTEWCTVRVVMTKGAGSAAKALAIGRSTAAVRICAAMSLDTGVEPTTVGPSSSACSPSGNREFHTKYLNAHAEPTGTTDVSATRHICVSKIQLKGPWLMRPMEADPTQLPSQSKNHLWNLKRIHLRQKQVSQQEGLGVMRQDSVPSHRGLVPATPPRYSQETHTLRTPSRSSLNFSAIDVIQNLRDFSLRTCSFSSVFGEMKGGVSATGCGEGESRCRGGSRGLG